MVNGWRVEVRDRTRTLIGPCDVWTTLKATIRHRKAGGWTITLPESHPQAALFDDGGGILAWAPWSGVEPWFSGPVTSMQAAAPTATDPAVLTVTGVDDTALLADRLVMPVPAAAMDSQGGAAYWTATGPAEWVIRKVVDVNAGLSAPATRRMCDADPAGKLATPGACAGSSRAVSARFDNLLALVDALAVIDNLAVSLTQPATSTTPLLHVAPTVDRSAVIRLSQPAGTLTAGSVSVEAPRATHVLVAGGGEETARVLKLVDDPDTAATWRRIETLRDARDTSDPTVLTQRGQEALAELAPTGGASVTPVELPSQRFGVDYDLGDIVGVDFGAVSWTEVVTAVTVDVTSAGGQTITPVLGDETTASTTSPAIYARVRDLTRRLDLLERRQ